MQKSLQFFNYRDESSQAFWHAIDGMSLITISGGRGLFMFGTNIIEVDGDLLMLLPNNTSIGWLPDAEYACKSFFHIVFPNDLLGSLGREREEFLSLQKRLDRLDEFSRWQEDIDLYQKTIESFVGMDSISRTLALISVLNSLNELVNQDTNNGQAGPYKLKDWQRIDAIMNMVCKRFLKNIHIDEIASELDMDTQKVLRYFKKATGTTLMSFINDLRVEKATRLMLLMPNKPVNDVASLCGFRNPVSFNRHFHRCKGQPPAQYKKYLLEKK